MTLQTAVLRFKFDNFESFPSTPKKGILSGKQPDCNGNEWQLKLFPGGQRNGSNSDGNGGEDSAYISLYLYNEGTHEKHVKCSFIIRSANGLAACNERFDHRFKAGEGKGYKKFIKRSFILDSANNILVDGALTIDVDIQILRDRNFYHVSPNPSTRNILNLLESGDKGDVSFKIDDTIIHAHKFILGVNAPILASFCEGTDNESPVIIEETTYEVFRHVLRYVYGGDVPSEDDMLELGEELIDAADRFDVAGLKMAVEAHMVACCDIDEDNVIDYLLFAQSKTCPLLKEYAISYFVGRANDILHSDSIKKLESTELMTELMKAMAKNSDSLARDYDTGFRKMSVDELRKKLEEKGLDVDGSREILVARLESSEKSKKRPREDGEDTVHMVDNA